MRKHGKKKEYQMQFNCTKLPCTVPGGPEVLTCIAANTTNDGAAGQSRGMGTAATNNGTCNRCNLNTDIGAAFGAKKCTANTRPPVSRGTETCGPEGPPRKLIPKSYQGNAPKDFTCSANPNGTGMAPTINNANTQTPGKKQNKVLMGRTGRRHNASAQADWCDETPGGGPGFAGMKDKQLRPGGGAGNAKASNGTDACVESGPTKGKGKSSKPQYADAATEKRSSKDSGDQIDFQDEDQEGMMELARRGAGKGKKTQSNQTDNELCVDARPALEETAKGRFQDKTKTAMAPTWKENCEPPSNDAIDKEFQNLLDNSLVLIWIIGYTQKSVLGNKRRCLKILGTSNNLALISLDDEFENWLALSRKMGNEPKNLGEKIIARAQRIARKVIEQGQTLTMGEVCQAFKYAIIQRKLKDPALSGFFLDAFPNTVEEGTECELILAKSAVCLYFLSKAWTVNKMVEPEILKPRVPWRKGGYREVAAEATADFFGYKTIKILNAEELEDVQIHDIDLLVKKHLEGQGLPLHKVARHVHKHDTDGTSRTITEYASQVVVDHSNFQQDQLVMGSKTSNNKGDPQVRMSAMSAKKTANGDKPKASSQVSYKADEGKRPSTIRGSTAPRLSKALSAPRGSNAKGAAGAGSKAAAKDAAEASSYYASSAAGSNPTGGEELSASLNFVQSEDTKE